MRRYSIPTRLRSVFIAAVAMPFLPAAANDADPVAYLPVGTMMDVSFNVQQFLESPLIRDGGNFKPAVKDAVRALEGFGVDPTKDADRALLAVGEQLRDSPLLSLFQG